MARLGGPVEHDHRDKSVVEVGKQRNLGILFHGLVNCRSGLVGGYMVLRITYIDVLLDLDQQVRFKVEQCDNACLAC